jgi:hypothetical protein
MTFVNAINLAGDLLNSELAEFKHNPKDYCDAMNWAPDSIATKKAIKNVDRIKTTADDSLALGLVIMETKLESSIDIKENNQVSDFLVNCIAKHIIKSKK